MTTTTSDGSTASYYELPQGATQLQDLISHRNMNAQDGEIFRAIYRKGLASHSDALRDARKVLFYAQAEVKRLEALEKTGSAVDLGEPNPYGAMWWKGVFGDQFHRVRECRSGRGLEVELLLSGVSSESGSMRAAFEVNRATLKGCGFRIEQQVALAGGIVQLTGYWPSIRT